jgi:hypothetical protein
MRTWSYAGGTNAAGALIPRGGFDPILALFNSSGLLIDQNDDGGANVPADIVTGVHYDTFLQANLPAGNYTVAVMQYSNFANGPSLADGFEGSGTSNWVDATGDERNGYWAFDILNVQGATQDNSVPDGGSTLVFLSAAFIAVAGLRRKLAA